MRYGPIRLFFTVLCGTSVLLGFVGVAGLAAADRLVVQRAETLDQRYPNSTHLDTAHLSQASIFEDATQTQIGAFYTQNRTVVPLAQIPPLVQDAFIAAEDAGFWTEPGIDPAGIFRSTVRDAAHQDARPAGASTIPQQVVKNLVMNNQPMTLPRKIDEAILALRAVALYGRPALLSLYLNEIYLGDGAYGVAAAAQTYFGKPLAKLDIADVAMLGGLPKSPAAYDPLHHPQAATSRRLYVLTQMVKDGFITQAKADQAAAEPLVPTADSTTPAAGPGVTLAATDANLDDGMGWARDAARTQFLALPIAHDGDTVRLTIDPRLQLLGQRALQWGLLRWSLGHQGWTGAIGRAANPPSQPSNVPIWLQRCVVLKSRADSLLVRPLTGSDAISIPLAGVVLARGAQWPRPGDVVLAGQPWPDAQWQVGGPTNLNGSLVAIDPKTGAILSLIGGFLHTPSQFDRAYLAERQPGSAFKPFIYLGGAEAGLTSDSMVLDAPIALSQGAGLPLWTPADDGDAPMGPVTFEKALALSLNDAAIRMLYQVDLPQVSAISQAFGLYPEVTTYTAALGAQDITNVQLTGGYAGLANDGFVTPPHLIAGISRSGQDLWQPPAGHQAAPAAAVTTIQTALGGTVQYGTASALQALAKQFPGMAGKTGTAQSYTNATFEGFIPGQIALGVFVGYDMPKPMGSDAYSAEVSVPIWGWFMQRYAAALGDTAGSVTSSAVQPVKQDIPALAR
jgi:penicillin-binding protein 1A